MNLTINYFGQFGSAVQKKRGESRGGDGNQTLGSLITKLCDEYGENFKNIIMDTEGGIRPSALIVVNGVQSDNDKSLVLEDGDEVNFYSAIAGG